MSSENKNRVLIADAMYGEVVAGVATGFPGLDIICVDEKNNLDSLIAKDITGIIVQEEKLNKSLLDKMSRLKVVLKMGRNYHNIDSSAVREKNIVMASAPRKGPNCVAELATTLLLSLSKQLMMSHKSVVDGAYRLRGLKPERSAQWKMAFHWMRNERVHEVRGKTLGIIGMGEIGCELALRASVLGMTILYHKRTPLSPELENRFFASYRDLDGLLRESDYVCIVVPHTPETEKMIGAEQFKMMKTDAYFVNVCRGGVVDEGAMIQALQDGSIAGAGLDAFTFEPLPFNSPLLEMHNVILTPHIGGGSGTNKIIELTEGLEEMDRILKGSKPRVDLS